MKRWGDERCVVHKPSQQLLPFIPIVGTYNLLDRMNCAFRLWGGHFVFVSGSGEYFQCRFKVIQTREVFLVPGL